MRRVVHARIARLRPMSRFRVDLRSDTVTAPSPEMRRAMAEAEVGDAWYGDDPTVNRLQELASECLGTEAALYVPTGTMANQIALALHTSPGHLAACSEWSHVATTEVMTSAALSGIAFRTADPGPRGWIDAEIAAALLEPDSYYDVEVVDVVSVENTVGGSRRPRDARRGAARGAQGRRGGRGGGPSRRCQALQCRRGRRSGRR